MYATLYDHVVRWTAREGAFKRDLVLDGRLEDGMRVLDLGCGTGTLLALALSAGAAVHLVGFDRSDTMLARASAKLTRRNLNASLCRGCATSLPFANDAFDRVVSTFLFHHLRLEEKRSALAEAHRVLRVGAEIFIADFGVPAGRLQWLASRLIQAVDGNVTTADNLRGRLPALLREARFAVVPSQRLYRTVWGTIRFVRGLK